MGGEDTRVRVEAELRAALDRCLNDPLEPAAAESVAALLAALGDLLYVVWPAGQESSPDGVRLALIRREGERVSLTGCVVMLYGGRETSHRLRPLAADLSRTDGTIRVASASEEVELKDSAELKFADATAVRRWDRTIHLQRGCRQARGDAIPSPRGARSAPGGSR